MSQQRNDDLERALDGLGESKPKPAEAPPATKFPQIKIQQAPAKPAQPTARPVQPVSKPVQMPRPMVRATGGTSSNPTPRAARAASPLDAPAALVSAIEAKPVAKPATRKQGGGGALARTMIPILLTLGFILIALCAVRFLWKSFDNPMHDISPNTAWMVGAFGVVLWALAALVMFSVARQMRAVAAIPMPATASAAPQPPKRPSRAVRPD